MLEQIFALRIAAWRERVSNFPELESWEDPFDFHPSTRHWVVTVEGTIVAAARLSLHDSIGASPDAGILPPAVQAMMTGRIGAFGRLFVRRSHAGLGLSQQLDRVRLGFARDQACQWVWGATHAGEHRIRNLAALGFQVVGPSLPYASQPLASLPPATIIRMQITD